MIRRCDERDFEAIWAIVNNGAQAYKGIIPADRWAEPYMSRGGTAPRDGRWRCLLGLGRSRDSRRSHGTSAGLGRDPDPPRLCAHREPETRDRRKPAHAFARGKMFLRQPCFATARYFLWKKYVTLHTKDAFNSSSHECMYRQNA